MTPHPATRFPARRPVLTGLGALMLLLVGFVTWAALANIAGAIITNGRVEVDRNRQLVQHPHGGMVQDVLVEEGMQVRKGQVLVRLDGEGLWSELTLIEAQLSGVLAERARAEAERDGMTEPAFDPALLQAAGSDDELARTLEGHRQLLAARLHAIDSRTSQLDLHIRQIESQIDGMVMQHAALAKQASLVAQELADQQALLARGLTHASRVRALQREEAVLAGQSGAISAQLSEARSRITQTRIEVLRLHDAQREAAIERLRDVRLQEEELREKQRAILLRLERLDIRAPVDGVVHGLQVFSRAAVLRPADPILSLIPQDWPLVVIAQIEPRDVDSVHPGQQVLLRLTGLDRHETPELSGTVSRLSADTFADPGSGAVFFRAVIHLEASEGARLPHGQKLVPGMPVEVWLRTGDRTALQFLSDPLMQSIAGAMREE